MSHSWKQYEGQVINNAFPLLRLLGGSDQSVVFLTNLAGPQSSNAAIKLIPEGHSGDLQLSLWRRAAKVTHPNVLRLYQGGRCRLADMDLLYVVMEYAEEDLSQVLPQRPLTPAEARDMLGPVLDALSDLHFLGLVHSHLKPSNILATADQVKLSSDRLTLVDASRISPGKLDLYDAPESANQPLTPACDVWSLAMTMVQVLTQHPPQWQPGGPADPLLPKTLPRPFLDIAQNSLRQNPAHRWTIAQIRACLNPAAAAAAAQSVAPLSVPLSPVAPVPAAKLQPPRTAPPVSAVPLARLQTPRPAPPAPRPPVRKPWEVAEEPEKSIVLPSYIVPLIGAALILAAIIALPRILGKRIETSSSTVAATNATETGSPDRPVRQDASRNGKSNSSPANRDAGKAASANQPAKVESVAPAAPAASAPAPASPAPTSPAPASLRAETKAPATEPRKSSTGSSQGEVLDSVLPEVSEKALSTIHGTVRVGLRLHVDAAGNVSAAELADPGPSQYFSDLALKAARRWEFTPPEGSGHSVPSEWQVRFEFSPAGVKAFPSQTSP